MKTAREIYDSKPPIDVNSPSWYWHERMRDYLNLLAEETRGMSAAEFYMYLTKQESDVNLEEFMSKVKLLFPNGEWKDYKLETNVEINWTNPIYIDRWRPYRPYPWYPWNPIIYQTDSGYELNWSLQASDNISALCSADTDSGVYNVEA